MKRALRPLALTAILLAPCLQLAGQSEPAPLPVTQVPAEPQQAPAPAVQPRVATPVSTPVDDSKARIARLEADIAKLKTDLAAARAQVKTAKSQSASTGGQLKEERDRAVAERDALAAKIATLTADKQQAESSRDQARINLASANARLATYENTLREGAPVETADLQAALQESQKKVDMTVRAFAVIEQENSRIRSQLAGTDIKSLKSELETTKQALAAAQNDLAAEKTRSSNLARELSRTNPGMALVIEEPPALAAPTAPSAVAETEPAAPAAEPKIHTVAEGETLSAIAKSYYGSAARWIDIFNANRDILKDENHVAVGMKLKIP